MADNNLKKGKFIIIPGKGSETSVTFNDSDKIEFTFNPTKYTIDNKNTFKDSDTVGLISPIFQFTEGSARTLKVDLMLDTMVSEKGENEKEDVRDKYIKRLQKLMKLDKEIHAPPLCQVLWGSLNFKGVLESMNTNYILFTNEGIPVRAEVTLNFKEFIPLSKQVKDPSLHSPDRRKLFKMTQGESLWNMSNRAYGDPGLWRVIADANDIDDPREIEIGKDLVIPVLETLEHGRNT